MAWETRGPFDDTPVYPCFTCGKDAGFGNPKCAECRPGREVFKPVEPVSQIPVADWHGAWRELRGYVMEAVEDGGGIDPEFMLTYMTELETITKAAGKEWLQQMMREN